ncbi:MAG: efflux RND transporter periplasmic adaptor subunit, partial [Planctomycetaceae bacterium]|nr:efflux RND transporter periplasmic adaptor subunit [Planctomycetaceae bacterium]
ADPARPAEQLAVEVTQASQELLQERIELVGSLSPIAETEIRSRVSGYLVEQADDVGSRVNVGEVLIKLDARDQREIVARAEAGLRVAAAQLKSQQAELDQAQRTVERQQSLTDEGAGTVQQLETAQAALAIAQARVELEQSRVEEAEANLEQARLALNDFELIAPITGFIAERFSQVGDLAKPDVPLLRIVSLDRVQTTVHVVEKDYRKIQLGQQADVTIDAFPGQVFPGIVKQIAPVLDPNTRTAEVRLDVENPKFLLKPGMYARVSLRSQRSQPGVVIPLASVLDDGEQTSVMTVEGTPPIVRRHIVELGATDGRLVEVLDGITAKTQVITLGNRLVREGQEVKVVEVPLPRPELSAATAPAASDP